jgi:predicted ATP-dependent serine protease
VATITEWLASLGLPEYAQRFAENGIDVSVGRDEDIDLVKRRWDQVKRGEGCVVLISGEAGIGKSRIAQTVAERISAEPHTRLRYFCSLLTTSPGQRAVSEHCTA